MTGRESIWSVPQTWRELYFILFSIQVVVCTGLVIWYEVFVNTGDNGYETFMAIGRGASPFVVVIAGQTVILVEALFMLSERYLQRRYRLGKAEGLSEGYKQWEAWNNRRMAAEAEGRPFDEPPPSPPAQENGRN